MQKRSCTETAKLCKNCKHVRWGVVNTILSPLARRWAHCAHPKALIGGMDRGVGFINGAGSEGSFCSVMRCYDCGPEGKLWEAQ